ncbi:MAG: YgjV family protein [Chloroflexota bacterium]
MDTANIFELIGYSASIMVATSLTMRSLLKLRLINLVGSFLFVVYGLLIGAWPVVVLNGFTMLVNLYYLQQMQRKSTVAFTPNAAS